MINKLLSFFGLIVFLFLLNFSYGQNNIDLKNDNVTGNIVTCATWKYYIEWPFDVKLHTPVEYDINLKVKNNIQYNLILFSGDKIIKQVENDKLVYVFNNFWDYKIELNVKDLNLDCIYSQKQNVKTFEKLYVYVWYFYDFFNLWLSKFFWEKKILLKIIALPSSFYDTQQWYIKFFQKYIYYIKYADILVINYENITDILDIFSILGNFYNINFSDKKLFIVVWKEKIFLQKLLLKYMKILNLEGVYLIDKAYFVDFFLKNQLQIENIKDSQVQYYSMKVDNISQFYFLSYIVDLLIFNWFPTNLLGLMLVIWFSVLIITFFRQMIWLSVFSVYHPLIFAISFYILWFIFSLFLFFVSVLSTLIVRLLTKKIYLLYSAKISLLVVVYIILILLGVSIDILAGTNLVNIRAFSNTLIIFPIISILLVANKILHEWFKLVSFKFWFSFIEFFILVFIIYLILSSSFLKFFFLSYPETILIILILNILIWRFTWLQLTEYFRFYPLIKKHFEE